MRGRKRTISHEAVIAFAVIHPLMLQTEIAGVFGTSQSRVSHILCTEGIRSPHRGRPIKRRDRQTTEQYTWEKILHDSGLGMDRGLRLANQRILYGYDPRKETIEDDSATSATVTDQQIDNR